MISSIRAGANACIWGPADALGDGDPRWALVLGIEVEPVVDLLDRHHQRVARPQRSDGEEGDAPVVAPHEPAGELAVDDAVKMVGTAGIVCCSPMDERGRSTSTGS